MSNIKIPPNKWVQIGGDVNYEDYGLVIARYDPAYNEICIVDISPPNEEDNKYFVETECYGIDELENEKKNYPVIDSLKNNVSLILKYRTIDKIPLEHVAATLFYLFGGTPLHLYKTGFYSSLTTSEFDTFGKALEASIGRNEEFIDWNGEIVKVKDYL